MADDRRGDWEHGVDENLASLNAGQRVWERELAVIRKLLADTDRLLRGDPEKDTDGAMARLHAVENELLLLKAVLLKDAAGGRGIVGKVEDLERGERLSDRRLKVWIAVLGLASASVVALMSNLDRLQAFFHQKSKDPVERLIENAKHPRRHHAARARPDPEEEPIE